ncbi:MAG: BMP family ABC transporter substrate-binding protein, partial [Actinobacteria bacterium]|nr:BMP family ABC transporter substrate-binding protein [Actinomycetota bacterium]
MKKGMLSVLALVAMATGMLIGVASSSAQAPTPAKAPSSGPAFK